MIHLPVGCAAATVRKVDCPACKGQGVWFAELTRADSCELQGRLDERDCQWCGATGSVTPEDADYIRRQAA